MKTELSRLRELSRWAHFVYPLKEYFSLPLSNQWKKCGIPLFPYLAIERQISFIFSSDYPALTAY